MVRKYGEQSLDRGAVLRLAWAGDRENREELFLSALNAGIVELWKTDSGDRLGQLDCKTPAIGMTTLTSNEEPSVIPLSPCCVISSFSPQSREYLFAHRDGAVYSAAREHFINIPAHKRRRTDDVSEPSQLITPTMDLQGDRGWNCARFATTASGCLMAAGGDDVLTSLYDVVTGKAIWKEKSLPNDSLSLQVPTFVNDIAICPLLASSSGTLMASAMKHHAVRIFDTRAQRRAVAAVDISERACTTAKWSPCGRYLLVGDTLGCLYQVDVRVLHPATAAITDGDEEAADLKPNIASPFATVSSSAKNTARHQNLREKEDLRIARQKAAAAEANPRAHRQGLYARDASATKKRGHVVAHHKGCKGAIRDLSWASDDRIAAASLDRWMRIYSITSKKCLTKVPFDFDFPSLVCSFPPLNTFQIYLKQRLTSVLCSKRVEAESSASDDEDGTWTELNKLKEQGDQDDGADDQQDDDDDVVDAEDEIGDLEGFEGSSDDDDEVEDDGSDDSEE